MTYRSPFLASLAFALIAAGCGSTVIGGNTGGSDTGTTTETGTTTTYTGTGTTTGTYTGTTTGTYTGTTTTVTGTTSTTTSTTTVTGGGGHAGPPAVGPMVPPDGTGSHVFAIRKLYLGNTDRDGTPDAVNGWKNYGFDLDGDISTSTSINLCKPLSNGSPHTVYPDGFDGADNSFGKNILPILLGLSSDFPAKVNDSIAQGHGTILLDLEKLGAGADYAPLAGRFYLGGDLGHVPTWNGTDAWPVNPDSLANPADVTSAKVQTAQSYVVGNTWVGAFQGDIHVILNGNPFPLDVPIHNPIIAMDLDPAHQNAANGTIAGVVPTAAFVKSIKTVAGQFDPTLCSGPTIDSITAQIQQASDILLDGSQDPTKSCEGISIGLGFEARLAPLGPIAPPAPPPPNPCGP